jgi:hypothetical protein
MIGQSLRLLRRKHVSGTANRMEGGTTTLGQRSLFRGINHEINF